MESTATDPSPFGEIDAELKRRLVLVFIASALLIASVVMQWSRPEDRELAGFLALAGALIVTLPIVWDVLHALRSRGFAATQFFMDQYIVLAVAACLASGRYVTGGIVATILIVGQILEERSVIGVREAVASLMKLSRVRARRVRDGREEEVDAEALQEGDLVRVRPGDTIPADGVIMSGETTIDQSSITGESLPIDASKDTEVFAGTTNQTGLIEIRVTQSGNETVLGKVGKIIEDAKTSEAPIMRLAEDYARYYTPFILLIAGSVFFFTRDLERAISVIIVSIPCAFVLASPTAMVAALACASRLGILIKGTSFLESAGEIDTVVFDKTGTLTEGKLKFSGAESFPDGNRDEDEWLTLAASLQKHSSHPVGRAVLAEAEERDLILQEATHVQEAAGKGIKGFVDGHRILIGRESWLQQQGIAFPDPNNDADRGRYSLLYIAIDDAPVGCIRLTDTLRHDARASIDELKALGAERFVMLTGDRQVVADAIATKVGLTEVQANCLPEEKLAKVEDLRKEGRQVMVVGDGVNDAPALAAGDLGVAMGALGNDVAINTADVALMTNNLRYLSALMRLSRRAVTIINQNLICGFLFILASIIISSLGWVNPIAAAFIHEFSAFFVILNSTRLLRFDPAEALHAEQDEARSEELVPLFT